MQDPPAKVSDPAGMTRIVTTHYRYKRPPGRKKPVALAVPAVVTAKSSRRPIEKKAAAGIQFAPVSGRKGAVQPSTPCAAGRVAHPDNDDRKPAIATRGRLLIGDVAPGGRPSNRHRHVVRESCKLRNDPLR